MKDYKVPIQSLIDHIKTAIDVDPWAKEMAEELLKEQEIVRCKDCMFRQETCIRMGKNSYCRIMHCFHADDWFCGDGKLPTNCM